MDTDNYIKYYKNVIDGDLCSNLINHKFSYEPSAYATHNSGGRVKNDRVVSNDFWVRKDSIYFQGLKSCYDDVIKRYNLDFDLFTVQHLTDFRISKYEIGGFMSRHVDNIHHSHGQQWGFPQATSLLFLNDDYGGGNFVVAEKTFCTAAGSALIFPSNFMYPHEVTKISEGTRYSVTCWLM